MFDLISRLVCALRFWNFRNFCHGPQRCSLSGFKLHPDVDWNVYQIIFRAIRWNNFCSRVTKDNLLMSHNEPFPMVDDRTNIWTNNLKFIFWIFLSVLYFCLQFVTFLNIFYSLFWFGISNWWPDGMIHQRKKNCRYNGKFLTKRKISHIAKRKKILWTFFLNQLDDKS